MKVTGLVQASASRRERAVFLLIRRGDALPLVVTQEYRYSPIRGGRRSCYKRLGSTVSSTVSAKTATRVTSFDVSRGIAISLMVLGHSVTAVANTTLGVSPGWALFNEIFSVVRMPLFFFLAGVFLVSTLKKRGYGGWVLDKAQYLLYPWLVWSLLRGLLEVGLVQFGIGGQIELSDVFLGIVWNPRIWYLPALFVAFAVIGGVYALVRGRRWWPFVALGAVLILFQATVLSWWPPLLNVHPFTLFMLAGCVLGSLAVMLAKASRWQTFGIGVAAASAFTLAVWFAAPAGLLSEQLSPVFVACAVVGVTALVALGRLLDKTPPGVVLERLGKWSLVIYVSHAIPVSFTRIVLMQVGVSDRTVLILVPAIFGIALPALLGWLHDRGILRWLITMPGYRKVENTRLP